MMELEGVGDAADLGSIARGCKQKGEVAVSHERWRCEAQGHWLSLSHHANPIEQHLEPIAVGVPSLWCAR